MRNFSTILPNYTSILQKQQNSDHQIRFITSTRYSNRNISSTATKPDHTIDKFHGRAELDSHTDTTVVGRKCTVLHHKERSCDVDPFLRHVWSHEICWHCVVRHRVHISECPTIHRSISWDLIYAGTWSYPDQTQPIAPVPHASPRKSIPCYITYEYYQSKQIFYRVLGISRDKYIPQDLFSNSDRPNHIPTYWIDFTPTVESISNWVPLNKILCEEGHWGAKCV